MSDLLIKGGTVLLESGPRKADLAVSGGLISAVLKPGTRVAAARTLDASGLVVMPGVIDPHVHFELGLGGGKTTADDFPSGSAAALAAGVTTVIDYTGQGPGVPLARGLALRRRQAAGRMHCDYSFHCVIPDWNSLKDPGAQLSEVVKAGVPTFKVFTAYARRGLMSGDAELLDLFGAAAAAGALVCVHAENGQVIDSLSDRFAGTGPGADALRLSRPAYTEWEAVQRVLVWAALKRAGVYFVHLSSAESAALVARARELGVKAFGETCPQYLSLDERLFRRRDGHLYACCPPVRTAADRKGLLAALGEGTLQTLATDHCAFTRAQKNAWKGDIRKLYMGLPGVATLLPLAYTLGCRGAGLGLDWLRKALCENPARLHGLFPRKGAIRPGSDADLTVFDPRASRAADWRRLGGRADYSPYQGMKLSGWAEYVVLGGELAAEKGRLPEPAKPRGRFLKRGPWLPA